MNWAKQKHDVATSTTFVYINTKNFERGFDGLGRVVARKFFAKPIFFKKSAFFDFEVE